MASRTIYVGRPLISDSQNWESIYSGAGFGRGHDWTCADLKICASKYCAFFLHIWKQFVNTFGNLKGCLFKKCGFFRPLVLNREWSSGFSWLAALLTHYLPVDKICCFEMKGHLFNEALLVVLDIYWLMIYMSLFLSLDLTFFRVKIWITVLKDSLF